MARRTPYVRTGKVPQVVFYKGIDFVSERERKVIEEAYDDRRMLPKAQVAANVARMLAASAEITGTPTSEEPGRKAYEATAKPLDVGPTRIEPPRWEDTSREFKDAWADQERCTAEEETQAKVERAMEELRKRRPKI